jgi:2-oxoisovalerate dehydrogenase E1 component
LGEDVGKKGGVYNVTSQLVQQFGANRVINTLLDEQSILGLGIGLAQQGFLPVPEIQFLAYVHNAEDQIRGEAATLPFFSNGQYQNPMVVRIAGLAYQRGFGGHFHNDNSFAVFRDIPGLLLFCPSNGRDASLLLRQALELAHVEKRLVIFLEPIALYMTRDLHQPGDNLWACELPALNEALPELGAPAIRPHQLEQPTDVVIISYANGFYLSCQAQQQLAAQGIAATVLDLRYLVPLHIDQIAKAIGQTQKVLIVDECRRRGSLSEELFTALHEHKPNWYQLSRLCAQDSFIPLGAAAYTVLPSVAQIIEKSLVLVGERQQKQQLEQVG